MSWFVYLLRCANGALYTGITTDIPKRLTMHNAGKGSAYVRAHRPARLLAFTTEESRSAASILEYHVKSLNKAKKLALAKKWKADIKLRHAHNRLSRAVKAEDISNTMGKFPSPRG